MHSVFLVKSGVTPGANAPTPAKADTVAPPDTATPTTLRPVLLTGADGMTLGCARHLPTQHTDWGDGVRGGGGGVPKPQ
jgi:hypothetical protein